MGPRLVLLWYPISIQVFFQIVYPQNDYVAYKFQSPLFQSTQYTVKYSLYTHSLQVVVTYSGSHLRFSCLVAQFLGLAFRLFHLTLAPFFPSWDSFGILSFLEVVYFEAFYSGVLHSTLLPDSPSMFSIWIFFIFIKINMPPSCQHCCKWC